MNIGILGTGMNAFLLCTKLSTTNHTIFISSYNDASLRSTLDVNKRIREGSLILTKDVSLIVKICKVVFITTCELSSFSTIETKELLIYLKKLSMNIHGYSVVAFFGGALLNMPEKVSLLIKNNLTHDEALFDTVIVKRHANTDSKINPSPNDITVSCSSQKALAYMKKVFLGASLSVSFSTANKLFVRVQNNYESFLHPLG